MLPSAATTKSSLEPSLHLIHSPAKLASEEIREIIEPVVTSLAVICRHAAEIFLEAQEISLLVVPAKSHVAAT